MQLYDKIIDDIKSIQTQKACEKKLTQLGFSSDPWPVAGNRNLVLQSDTAVELGNPADEAVSLCLWTEGKDRVAEDCISLIGPDISPGTPVRLPFGKIVLLRGTGFDEDNIYDRYREMDLACFDVSLKGFMMRATAQYMREWNRISKEAVNKGFSFATLGSALITEFKKLPYIESVEVIFITSSNEDVRALSPMANQTDQINKAMSKMIEEMSASCEDCEYEEICDEVSALRNMRKAKEKRRG